MDTLRKESLANDFPFSSLHPVGMFNHLECLCCEYRFKSHTSPQTHCNTERDDQQQERMCLPMAQTSSPLILAIGYPPWHLSQFSAL